jgi:hypothetical protein
MAMTNTVNHLGGILLLRREAYLRQASAANGVGLSLSMVAVAGLIAGLGQLAGAADVVTHPSLVDRMEETAAALAHLPDAMPPAVASVVEPFAEEVSAALEESAGRLEAVEPPLGAGTSRALRAIGTWASTPLSLLAAMLSLAVPVMLVARWMGGKGTLHHQVGLVLFAAIPQALTVLDSFPNSGGLASLAKVLGAVAFVWGAAIFLRGLALANGVNTGRAVGFVAVALIVFVVVAPIVVGIVISILVAVTLGVIT